LRASARSFISALQPSYSMLRRGIEDGFAARANGIGVIIYSPCNRACSAR
jgi:aryl-alcohol dehydrogenase-like predicted oxidoreductase